MQALSAALYFAGKRRGSFRWVKASRMFPFLTRVPFNRFT
jgi:hypothetical protein